MSLEYVRSLFESENDVLVFEGNCHDCGRAASVVCIMEDNEISVSGGAFWREIGKNFIKCEACFKKEPLLTRFMPCEVYSRVTGYLRPVKQWNAGKREEFKQRKMFKMP